MNPRDLIETARHLAESGAPQPTQADLRRAVSTAYYAMCHCLAASAADLFIGAVRNPAWHRTYRALEHDGARGRLSMGRRMWGPSAVSLRMCCSVSGVMGDST